MSDPNASHKFFRAFSDSSAGGCLSDKGSSDRQLSPCELLWEFQNHKHGQSRIPTALISVTNTFLDAILRAAQKYCEGEKPENTWIIFITVTPRDGGRFHHAERLAKVAGLNQTKKYKHEYIFEWEIPKNCINHKISLKTLLKRGFKLDLFLEPNGNGALPLNHLRGILANAVFNSSCGGYDNGMNLGYMARCFGARAPVLDLAHQISSECTSLHEIDYFAQTATVSYGDSPKKTLSFEYLYQLETGIDTAIFEMWLNDVDFCLALKDHNEWAARLEDYPTDEWMRLEALNQHSHLDPLVEHHKNLLQDELVQKHQEIEADAIELGL